MTAEPVPDFEWYAARSQRLSASPRCQFASADHCPRFFASLSLMGKAGATKMEKSDEERLLNRWRQSKIWPRTAEQDTSISFSAHQNGSVAKASMYVNFCPEVTFEFFNVFASYLSDYADEIDRDLAHRRLVKTGALRNDWRWRWSSIRAMHYSECPLYSLLHNRNGMDDCMDASKRSYLEKRLEDMVASVVEDCMQAVSTVMTQATLHGALGNSRVWLQYNEAIVTTVESALPQLIQFAYAVAGDNTAEATEILNTAILKLERDARDALVKRTSLAAQAFGEKPMYESLGASLKRLREQSVEDFSHGIEGGRPLKKDQGSGISVSVTGSPGAQVAAGQHINQAMNQQSRVLMETIDAALASEAFTKMSKDQAELVRDYADLVKGELRKPDPDSSKIKSWTEKIQLYLSGANLAIEAGKIATALLSYLGVG
jgi:hypothetical protein